MKEGIIEVLLKLLKKNLLLTDVVLTGMDSLDGLAMNKIASS